jgi:hypothetical protein
MNFIEQQRQTIIEEGSANSGQTDLLDYLDHLNPQLSDIIFREPLTGDLDFTVLKECNFTNITSLQFVKGKITSLKNIPEGITKLICPENLLTEFPELPTSIVELNLKENGIKQMDLKELENLKELTISNNHLITLDNLPKDLESLYCENNYLRTLDLDGMDKLKVLHCSNNPLLVIEHFPETVSDFQMSNNPMTEIQRLTTQEDSEKDKENDNVESRADFTESLNTYFELKTEYENHVYNMRKHVFKQAKTKTSAKKQLASLKPKCINCNRPVGSIFTNEGRTYIARCGDAATPCNLDIRLFAGEYASLDSLLETFQESVQLCKENIIKQKLDALFNYITEREAVVIFKKEFEEYTESNTFLKELETEYTNIYFNEERKEKVNRKIAQIATIRERVIELFKKYKQTDNREVLKDAMTIYIQELKPEMDNLQLLKYEIIELDRKEIDRNTVLYELQQKEYRIDALDFTFGTYPKVVRFRTKK